MIALAAAGPLSKFDTRKPTVELETARTLYDVERCLIDTEGFAPTVFRQPDRPNQVTLLWVLENVATYRIDLRSDGSVTRVKAWHPEKPVRACV